MKISKDGLDFIKRNEGTEPSSFRNGKWCAYWDRVAGCWTIFYGVCFVNGKPVNKYTLLDQIEAEEAFYDCVKEAEQCVESLCEKNGVKLAQREFDALVDFAYNAGTRALRNSCLWKFGVAKGDKERIKSEFMRWVFSQGKRVEGLANRRRKEIAFYFGE